MAIDKKLVYLGAKPCGCVCAVGSGSAVTSKDLSDWVTGGLAVSAVTREDFDRTYRARVSFECEHEQKSEAR